MIVVAAVVEELGELDGVALGVGPVAAAAAMARLLATRSPDAVVLLGTAGAYPGGPAIGAVVTARTVAQGSGTAAMGLGYVPLAPAPITCVPAPGLPAVDVLACEAISTAPELARRLGERGAVEHMEAFGAAWACATAGVPFTAVLAITNEVGPDAHAQWRANRVAAQAAAVRAVAALGAGR